MSRIVVIWLFLQVSVPGLVAQSEVLVSGNFSSDPVSVVLRTIGENHEVKFAFDSKSLSDFTFSGTFNDVNISQCLDEITEDIPYAYRLVGKTWVIYPVIESANSGLDPTRVNFSWRSRVVDKLTMEPLPFATIRVNGSDLVAVSNREGYFTFSNCPSDTSTALISYVGYEDLVQGLDPSSVGEERPIYMVKDYTILPMVAIEGEQTRTFLQTTTPGQIVFNTSELSDLPSLGEGDAIRALQWIPGLNGTGESVANLNIRGGRSDENLVIYDGFTIYHTDHLFGIFSAFNNSGIKNIRLHRGWFDAKYGSRTAGIVEITGKEGNKNKPSADIGINLTSVNIFLQAPLVKEKVSLAISARRSFTDVIFSPAYRSLFNTIYNSSITQPGDNEVDTFGQEDVPDFHFYDVNAKISAQVTDRDHVQLSLYNGRDDLTLGYELDLSEEGKKTQYNDFSEWGNNGASLKYSRHWKSDWHSNLVIGYSNYTSQLFATDIEEEVPFSIFDTTFSEQSSDLKDLTVKLELERTFGTHKITGGSWYTSNDIQYMLRQSLEDDVDLKEDGYTWSYFLQDEFDAGLGSKINAGLRMTYFNGTNSMYEEPRVSWTLPVRNSIQLKLAFGRFYQFIRKIRTQDLLLNSPDFWRLSGLEDVPVLRSDQWIAGLNWSKNDWTVDVEAYFRQLDGAIEDPIYLYRSSIIRNEPLYIGNGNTQGVDILVQRSVGKHTGWLGSTISKTEYRFEQLDYYPIPSSEDQHLELKAVYIYRRPSFKFSAAFIYGTGRAYTPVLGTYTIDLVNGGTRELPAMGEINSTRLPEYHRLDLSATYVKASERLNLEVGLSIFNVYGRVNVQDIQYFVIPNGDNINSSITVGQRNLNMLGTVPTIKILLGF